MKGGEVPVMIQKKKVIRVQGQVEGADQRRSRDAKHVLILRRA